VCKLLQTGAKYETSLSSKGGEWPRSIQHFTINASPSVGEGFPVTSDSAVRSFQRLNIMPVLLKPLVDWQELPRLLEAAMAIKKKRETAKIVFVGGRPKDSGNRSSSLVPVPFRKPVIPL